MFGIKFGEAIFAIPSLGEENIQWRFRLPIKVWKKGFLFSKLYTKHSMEISPPDYYVHTVQLMFQFLSFKIYALPTYDRWNVSLCVVSVLKSPPRSHTAHRTLTCWRRKEIKRTSALFPHPNLCFLIFFLPILTACPPLSSSRDFICLIG